AAAGFPSILFSSVYTEPRKSIASTRSGQVRGRYNNGVLAFKGIPYGATTGWGNRFLPPKRPPVWAGVRDALEFGSAAMQPYASPTPEAVANWRESDVGRLFQGMFPASLNVSEDCLRLNVWTPRVDAHRRPVMVWLH